MSGKKERQKRQERGTDLHAKRQETNDLVEHKRRMEEELERAFEEK